MHRHHEKVSRDSVENRDGNQQKTGAEKGHDHVFGGGEKVPAPPANHDEPARGNRIDFDENVTRKEVVGVNQRHQGREKKVNEDVEHVLAVLGDIHRSEAVAAHQRQQHDEAEERGHHRFQNTRADFVSEGCGKCTHLAGNCVPIPYCFYSQKLCIVTRDALSVPSP